MAEKKKFIAVEIPLLGSEVKVLGTVQELKYVSGPPLLVQSAMDAVRQWRYQPTLLNGQPVKVDTVITVIYTLGG